MHGVPYTKCVKTEYVLLLGSALLPQLITLLQGYELAEEEVRISLDDFRERYAHVGGAPDHAFLSITSHLPLLQAHS